MRRLRKRTTWELKDEEVPPLLGRLARGTTPERAAAASALGLYIHSPRTSVLSALEEALARDSSPLVRSESALSLGEQVDRQSTTPIDALLRAVKTDSSARVRQCAAEAISTFRVRPHSLRSEAEHREQVVDALLDRVIHDLSRAVQTAAAWGLAGFPAKRLVPPLTAVFRKARGGLKDELAIALGFCGATLAEEPLAGMLRRPRLPARERVVWSLGTCAGGLGIDALLPQLQHPDLPVRKAAAAVLGSMVERRVGNGHEERLRVKIRVGFEGSWGYPCPTQEPPPNRRTPPSLAVLRARLVKPFIELLGDADGWVREAAGEALAYLGDRRAARPLLPLLHDEHGCAGDVAAYSLGRLGDPSVVPELLALVAGPPVRARERAIDALGLLRDERAREPLFKLVEHQSDGEASLAYAATFALAELGDPRLTKRMAHALAEVQAGREAGHSHFVGVLAHHGNATAQHLVELAMAHDRD